MNIDQAFPSKYLKSEDVPKPVMVEITGCEMGEVEEGKSKPILFFQPSGHFPNHEIPSIALNVTNANLLKSAYGPDTDKWAGQKVGLWVDHNVQFQGKTVSGLRVKVFTPEPTFAEETPQPVPDQKQPAQQYHEEQQATAETTQADPDFDFSDDIPY